MHCLKINCLQIKNIKESSKKRLILNSSEKQMKEKQQKQHSQTDDIETLKSYDKQQSKEQDKILQTLQRNDTEQESIEEPTIGLLFSQKQQKQEEKKQSHLQKHHLKDETQLSKEIGSDYKSTKQNKSDKDPEPSSKQDYDQRSNRGTHQQITSNSSKKQQSVIVGSLDSNGNPKTVDSHLRPTTQMEQFQDDQPQNKNCPDKKNKRKKGTATFTQQNTHKNDHQSRTQQSEIVGQTHFQGSFVSVTRPDQANQTIREVTQPNQSILNPHLHGNNNDDLFIHSEIPRDLQVDNAINMVQPQETILGNAYVENIQSSVENREALENAVAVAQHMQNQTQNQTPQTPMRDFQSTFFPQMESLGGGISLHISSNNINKKIKSKQKSSNKPSQTCYVCTIF